jgi:DNA-directed RNA polymerase subunit H
MNYEIVDTLYRSRLTLLAHLKKQGYEITPFTRFSPKEILEMLKAGENAFRMDLTRSPDDAKDGPTECRVLYAIGRIKQKLPTFLAALTDPENADAVDPTSTEVVVITLEPVVPVFHNAALSMWNSKKLRVRFFQAAAIVINPLEHYLVPPHARVEPEEVADLLKRLHITSRSNLPLIRFHEDPIARMLGLIPGDVVKITRPSPTALEYDPYYRVCAP